MARISAVMFLVVSLTANLALLAWWRALSRDTPAEVAVRPVSTRSTGPQPIDPQTWNGLNSGATPAELVARLRANGFPPRMIRTILRAQLTERRADRFKALAEEIARQPYWKGQMWFFDPKISADERALYREINAELRKLLGPDFNDLADFDRDSLRRRLGDLPPEKMDALQQIQQDYYDMMAEIRNAARAPNGMTMLLPDDREKLTLLEKEMRADIAQVLTAEELENYDLRNSRTANTLRFKISSFAPTEEEFLGLYRIQKAFDDQYPAAEMMTAEQRRMRTEAEKQLAPQIEAALGPERYAEYQKKTDAAWRMNNQFALQFSLPPEAVEQLYAIQKDITDRAKTVREGNAAYEQLSAQLAALQQEAVARLMPILGDRLLTGYRNSYGTWVRELRPPARPTPKPGP